MTVQPEPAPDAGETETALQRGLAIVTSPGVSPDLIAEMLEAMGGVPTDSGETLFPSGPREARCRVCGLHARMTEEHLPPRSAFNNGRGRQADPFAALGRDEVDLRDEGPVFQGGIRGHVLCRDCNNYTGKRWAREYQGWAARAYHLLSSQPQRPPEVDELAGYPGFSDVVFKDVYPGRFVRQVLSMMATISGSHELCERLPDIRELVLGGEPRELPAPLQLVFLLYGGPTARIAGGPLGQAWYDAEIGELRRVLCVDFPPLAFVLVVEGPPVQFGVDISSFTAVPVDHPQDIAFENLPLGFGHRPWPCDYRTKGQMLADRGSDP